MIDQDKSDPRVRRATRLAIANSDLLEAAAAIELAITTPNADGLTYEPQCIARQCYVTTAVVAYARPFSDNRGPADADPRIDLARYSAAAEFSMQIHELAMRLRNKAFAHAEATVRSCQLLAHSEENTLILATPKDRPEDALDFMSFKAHVDALLGYVQNDLHSLSSELQKEPGKLGGAVEIVVRES